MPPKRKAAAAALDVINEVQGKKAKNTEAFGMEWHEESGDFFYSTSPELKGSEKIAGFDMDHTIVYPKSGAKFAKNRADWEWWNPTVVPKLKELHEDGYKIVIFTNQGGIEKGNTKASDIQGKIIDLSEELGFPLQGCIAAATNHWRKPHSSMWEYVVEKLNEGVKVDKSKSFYCGDAAGRPKAWKKGAVKDFSCGDREFALNCGVEFHTPDELFLGEPKHTEFTWDGIDPVAYYEKLKNDKLPTTKFAKSEQEMVIMCGLPATGKSTFSKKYFVAEGYVRANKDDHGTKCLKIAKEAVASGKSVVCDNTNVSKKARAEYIAIAKEAGIPVRCFRMTTPRELAEHLNFVRERVSNGEVRRIPDVGFNTANKNWQDPDASEGFSEIVDIPFVPDFAEEKHKTWFTMRTG